LSCRFKGSKEVKKGGKYEMSYEDEVASLVIHKTEPDDAATYSVQAVNPMGSVKTQGDLVVHSKLLTECHSFTHILLQQHLPME